MMSIDTKEIIQLAAKLTHVHRAALPNAVRLTMNDLAFDVKKVQLMPALNGSGMTIRNPSFFKKYSGVEKATGWDILKMTAEVGMIPSGDASKAVSRLKQQDEGGSLEDRNFIPDAQARSGNNRHGKVKPSNYLKKMILSGRVAWGDKQGLIRAVTRSGMSSKGTGKGFVVIYGSNLYEITGFKRFRDQNSIKLHLRKLYTYQKDREIHVKPHHFMKAAAMPSGAKMQEFFNRNAEKQLSKFSKR